MYYGAMQAVTIFGLSLELSRILSRKHYPFMKASISQYWPSVNLATDRSRLGTLLKHYHLGRHQSHHISARCGGGLTSVFGKYYFLELPIAAATDSCPCMPKDSCVLVAIEALRISSNRSAAAKAPSTLRCFLEC